MRSEISEYWTLDWILYLHIAAVLVILTAHIAQRVSKMRGDQHKKDPGDMLVSGRLRVLYPLIRVHYHGKAGGLRDYLNETKTHLHEGWGRLAHEVAAHQQGGDHGATAGSGGQDEVFPVL